jgi:hypothetical protein
MNSVTECKTCQSLAAEYEAATMEWFRLQGQLRVAEYSREANASDSIVAELSQIATRRHALGEARKQHELDKHPRVAAAGSSE